MNDHAPRRGVRLGVDVGKARVGIARSDPAGILAVPVESAPRTEALSRLVALAGEYEALEVVVGKPISLSGGHTASTEDAESFAAELAGMLDCPVRLVDERLTTVQASAVLRDRGHSAKNQRGVIDQASAVIILQHSLDSEAGGSVAPDDAVGRPEGGS